MNLLTELQDMLHTISEGALIPTLIILIALIVVSVVSVGSIITEGVSERRRLQSDIPRLLADLHGNTVDEMTALVQASTLLHWQKSAFLELSQYCDLPSEELYAVAKRIIATSERGRNKILSVSETVSRLAPMFGLMGTLIPLGPGIIALGQGDTATLSSSMLVAFDTTVAGLISAASCFVISKIRSRWYEDDMVSLESMMDCMLEEVGSDA
ncbi:MAG: MotA/TolQ/ExbB proton channel family protein [Oscillospiraceae bacterium]|nr:MotA/TolQ/ExbB proton channel family protein [Oscillospiraceae bacterium]